MRRISCVSIVVLMALVSTLPVMADDAKSDDAKSDDAKSGFLHDFTLDFEQASQKLIDLGEAIPADKFSWGPTKEVRNVSQSIIHVAGANYFLSGALGVAMPEGFGQDAEEKITAKADVLAELKRSQEHVAKALENAASMDLDKEVEVFGRKMSGRRVLMIIAGHSHEHLGQLIAYARSVGVVPPWSLPAPSEEG